MSQSTRPPKSFECRFETDLVSIFMTREDMPEQTFGVNLSQRQLNVVGALHLEFGFSVFVERNGEPTAVVARLLRSLIDISPVRFSDTEIERFREVAIAWIMFNFRPALDDAPNHSRGRKI